MRGSSLLLLTIVISASTIASAQQQTKDPNTIVAREVPGWFYANGEMEKSEAQIEVTYHVTERSLIRVNARDFRTGQMTADNTEFVFLSDLVTFDRSALTFAELTDEMRPHGAVVRAIGRPGHDAIEILFIGPDWLQSVKTVRNYMVIQRFRRLQ